MATKLLLEHSDSNSSTDSAASSVGSGGSDGNSNEYHPPVQQKSFLPENGHSRIGSKALVPQFGLSPPSESKLLQRRNRYSVERKQPRSAKVGNYSREHTPLAYAGSTSLSCCRDIEEAKNPLHKHRIEAIPLDKNRKVAIELESKTKNIEDDFPSDRILPHTK